MKFVAGPDGKCERCGDPEDKHEWHCVTCGALSLKIGRCGCGAVEIPEPACECRTSWALMCPRDNRSISHDELGELQKGMNGLKGLGINPAKHWRWMLTEAKRLAKAQRGAVRA